MPPYAITANRFLPYDVLTAIPAQVLQTRDPEQSCTEKDARLVHDAFLLKFLVAMPCLQPKQIREARIDGVANIFKGPLSHRVDTVPEWAEEELRRDPAAELWQVRFSRTETSEQEIHAVLPHDLIPMLEQYLAQHRPLLVGGNDPGTLFLGKRGPLGARQLSTLIGNLTERFAGRRIVPASVRKVFVYCWLRDNPNDYFTLSRILGRRTILGLGLDPSVSSGMRSFEKWFKSRKRN